MSSPLLQQPGAVPAPEDSPDAGVPWHFGDPFAEQRSATRSAVVVDRSHRQVIAVPGEERLSWLHLVLSQHVSELPEGRGTEALVLDTDEMGRPDLLQVTYRMCQEMGAEAVFVLSNETVTRMMMSGLEKKGVPVYGPIWDS